MKYLLIILLSFFSLALRAQAPADSAITPPVVDSARVLQNAAQQRRADSVRAAAVQDSLRSLRLADSLRWAGLAQFQKMMDSSRYNRHPYLRFTKPQFRISTTREWTGKEGLFYGIVALVLVFGLLRSAFSRYLSDLFRTYFRTTIRQRLIKEQVANAPLPSLLFNLLFLLIGALLGALLLRQVGLGKGLPLWLLFVYCMAGLAVIYLGKYLVLKLFGWLLNAREAASTYLFIVFATNKVLGILLLILLPGLAFTSGGMYQAFLTLSVVVVCALFVYRFFLSFVTVQKLVKINLFHFLLYFFAMELVPLLLINKLLLRFFAQTP